MKQNQSKSKSQSGVGKSRGVAQRGAAHNEGRLPRVCIIGAGCSGMAAAKALKDEGIPFDCYEKGSDIGGLWRFGNDNGVSNIYESLHINTHRDRMEYRDYPMPDDYPDYPSHRLIFSYFQDYARKFGLYNHIQFNTSVEHVEPEPDGTYSVSLSDGRQIHYDSVMVANGHHWSERWPDPMYPGQKNFKGIQFHAHRYVDPEKPHNLVGKNVLVVGMGNSAMDIAVELSRPGLARNVFLSGRRGAYVFPKYLFGKPFDKLTEAFPVWVPFWFKEMVASLIFRIAVGKMSDFGLPDPDFGLGQAHPTISNEILGRFGSGDIKFRRGIQSMDARSIRFEDGSMEEIDAIVWCTGYNVSFPFFDEQFLSAPDNALPLFHRAIQPERPGICFVGLLQPLGPVMPLSEAQSKWYAKYLTGKYALPSVDYMNRYMEAEQKEMQKRYVSSARHTMQVDFELFLSELDKECSKGMKRAEKTGQPVNIPPLAHNYPEIRASRSGRSSQNGKSGKRGHEKRKASVARR
ncbi:MAG: NAD(P)-binding domain-containing protein [Leptospiraceae bacterium]|nr:NAD(P)-binding domain-containing protein [Leptospiraceae bacterium]